MVQHKLLAASAEPDVEHLAEPQALQVVLELPLGDGLVRVPMGPHAVGVLTRLAHLVRSHTPK